MFAFINANNGPHSSAFPWVTQPTVNNTSVNVGSPASLGPMAHLGGHVGPLSTMVPNVETAPGGIPGPSPPTYRPASGPWAGCSSSASAGLAGGSLANAPEGRLRHSGLHLDNRDQHLGAASQQLPGQMFLGPPTGLAPLPPTSSHMAAAASQGFRSTPASAAGGRASQAPVAPVTPYRAGTPMRPPAGPSGLEVRRSGSRYGALPAWASNAGRERASDQVRARSRSSRRPRATSNASTGSRSPTRQRLADGTPGSGCATLATAAAGRTPHASDINDGEVVPYARITDLIYYVTTTANKVSRSVTRLEALCNTIATQQVDASGKMDALAVQSDSATTAHRDFEASMLMLNRNFDLAVSMRRRTSGPEERRVLSKEQEARWVLDVGVCPV